MEQGCCMLTQHLIHPVSAALTLALWFWNHTCTTRTLSPVSAASVSLTWKGRDKTFAASHRKQSASQHTGILCLLNISSTFCSRRAAFWFQLNVEWMQWSFWTSWLLPLQSLGPGAAPVLGPGLRRHFSYLSTTFGALHQPASANTDQNAARHFKAQLWGGGDFFNSWILFVKLL